jgi:hypothetical protein
MMVNDLTPAERRVWNAYPRGQSVDFRAAPDEDASTGAGWGPERTLRASVLRELLISAPQEEGQIAGLKIAGARITGTLHLRYAVIEHPVGMHHCHFDRAPDLYGSRLRQLNLRGAVLPAINCDTVRVDGVLRMTECRVRGPVRLGGAQISGALFMDRAHLTAPNDTEPVLQLNQAAIGADLWAPGLQTHGEVKLSGADIAGSVNLHDAELNQPGGIVLNAETLTVAADVLLGCVQARGAIELRGARIAGRLALSHARLSNPGGTALHASSCTIGELWLRKGPPVDGILNLRRSQIELLTLEPEMVPNQVLLNNLSYTTLTPHEPTERRLPMLERDRDGYVPHAYEQLAGSYRRIGDDHAARLVQLAKQRRHRATLPWYARGWGHVQDATVGYGFRPLRAAGWLLSLLAIGSVAYALHHPRPLKTSETPPFNPVFYTLDLLLPVISFGQENAFAPAGWAQWLSYLLIVTGWILATAVVAGVTRTLSRQ